jgi:hypothetical protein
MAKRFDPDKLSQRLAPFGFTLNLPEVMKGGISFVRPSSVERLYEHILIRTGRPTYAEAVISAASFTSCHNCVSERDNRLRAFLSGESEFGTSLLRTSAEAKAWQKQLVENADVYCKRMASDKGPLLFQRLAPVFAAIDSYIQRLGDFFAILDREFAFLSEASREEQGQMDRLADNARQWLYLNSEDAKLASLALVRFGSKVEGNASPFQDKIPRQDGDLASRLILLGDYVRAQRVEYGRTREEKI